MVKLKLFGMVIVLSVIIYILYVMNGEAKIVSNGDNIVCGDLYLVGDNELLECGEDKVICDDDNTVCDDSLSCLWMMIKIERGEDNIICDEDKIVWK